MNCHIIITPRKNGKNHHECFLEGKILDTRQSARTYKYALIVRRRVEAEIQYEKTSIKHDQKYIREYNEIAACTTPEEVVKVELHRDPHASAWHLECAVKFWQEGRYQEWAANSAESLKKHEEKLESLKAMLAAGEQFPPFVLSWHQELRNVPKPNDLYDTVGIATIKSEAV